MLTLPSILRYHFTSVVKAVNSEAHQLGGAQPAHECCINQTEERVCSKRNHSRAADGQNLRVVLLAGLQPQAPLRPAIELGDCC
mmetsp:Transcript_17645/g.53039  ORF Transcript_17645/g.53039 Transcript_17645/m.53039 type:complete len:84 (+) Transcript_17645:663-914(+)